ncbi:MAG: hypothetical protein NZ528_14500 [Caldilineales bacterium]|nr:hypothetical protein [Caldilineales bacterium]MDW8318383.1 hypothetical protein [Anaerolineae bacterium]
MLLLPPAPAAAGEQPPTPDPRFGIVETFVNPEAATAAGAGYTRVILRWDVIQPTGPADWQPANVPDPLIAGELAAGRQVMGLLIGTPAWAVSPHVPAVPGEPASIAVPDMAHWEAFVRRVAQHYRGRIGHWVIWNEPDVWMAGHPGRTWAGSEADYSALLKTAYLAIKGVDPDMVVAMAGLTYYWDWSHGRRRYLDRLLDIIVSDPDAARHGYYFDAVVYHLYFTPMQIVSVLEETWATLARRGIAGKQVWINETNAPPSDDPLEPPWSTPAFRVSLAEQAAFILQAHALAFAAGAGRVEVYKLRNTADHPESIEPFGLLRGDNSPRPAFWAYQTATRYLGGFRHAYRQQLGPVQAVTFDRRDATTTVLWTTGRAPATARVAAISPQALLVDELGRSQPIAATAGAYTIPLPGATCTQENPCRIGGAPRLLVEQGAANGRVALLPPPSAVAGPPAALPRPATPAADACSLSGFRPGRPDRRPAPC